MEWLCDFFTGQVVRWLSFNEERCSGTDLSCSWHVSYTPSPFLGVTFFPRLCEGAEVRICCHSSQRVIEGGRKQRSQPALPILSVPAADSDSLTEAVHQQRLSQPAVCWRYRNSPARAGRTPPLSPQPPELSRAGGGRRGRAGPPSGGGLPLPL